MKRKALLKLKRGLALCLSSVLIVGTVAFGNIPGLSIISQAAEYDLTEDFNSYTGTSTLKGSVFGSPALSISNNDTDGTKALLVSDRTENYYSYSYDVKKYRGNEIKLTFDIKLPDLESETEKTISATIKTSKTGRDDDYNCIASADVTGSDMSVEVSGNYYIPDDIDDASIYFETEAGYSYILDNVKIKVVGEYNDPSATITYADISSYEELKDLYKDYFTFGVGCESISNFNNKLSEIGNPAKEALIKKEFNSITFVNELNPEYNMGYWDDSATETYLPFKINESAKEMLDWAKDNNIKVRGGALVYHSQCPDEIFCKNYTPVYKDANNKVLDPSCFVDKDTFLKRMESYIKDVMQYMYENGYGDTIYAWDVVNEAVEPGTNQYNLRDSYWYKVAGPDYIYYAFKYARQYSKQYAEEYASMYGCEASDIKPKLFYNDYNEFQENKRDAIIHILTASINGHSIKEEKLIDGVGMQAHLSDTTNIDKFIEALRLYDQEIGEVHITQLDVATTSTGVNADYYQAEFYNTLFKKLIEERKNGVNLTSVTLWGLTDDNSWKKESSPLVFNNDLSKKMAFDGIVYAVTGESLPEPVYVAPDLTDLFYDFEGKDVNVTQRGDGTVKLQRDVVFDGSSAIVCSGRTGTWNGVSFDVSRFVGQTIDISAWVKSDSNEVKLSADIDQHWPVIASADTSAGEWVQIKGRYSIPKSLTALKLYFETPDLEDIYIDNLKVKLAGLDEGFEEETNIASPRGVGHMPIVSVTDSDYRSGNHSLKVRREAQDANVKFDVSAYIGKKVSISAYVKTNDSIIRMGLDTDTPIELCQVNSYPDHWTLIETECTIPNTLTSAKIFIETEGYSTMLIDDFRVVISDYTDDLETDGSYFSTRWGGAGTLKYVKDGSNNHAIKLTDRGETYHGIAFDVSKYLGYEVEITCYVKTDDTEIYITGETNGEWPRYLATNSTPGEYKTIGTIVTLPKDLSALKLYIYSNGTSDIYVDNFKIRRVGIDDEYRVDFDGSPEISEKISGVFTKGYLIKDPEWEIVNGWYKDRALTEEWDFNTDRITEDMTLYAKINGQTYVDKPVVTEDPIDVSVQEGASATFRVSAEGENLNYQWKVDKNNGSGYENIAGATGNEYTISKLTLTSDGYKFICVVSNEAGSGQSEAAMLHVSKKVTVYDVIEGNNGKYEPESGEYTIRIDCDFSKFKDVNIDGKTVDPLNYTARSGSTIITFKPDFMKSLSSGIHTIVVNFKDGYSTTSVTVADDNDVTSDDKTNGDNNGNTTGKSNDNDKPSIATTKDSKNNAHSKDDNVKTGDNTAPFALMSILMISGLGLVVLAKKKNHIN